MNDTNFLGRWLSDSLSEKEKKEFENSQEYLAYKDIINGVDRFESPKIDFTKKLESQKIYNKKYKEPSEKKSKIIKLKTWVYSIAAVLALFFGLKIALFNETKINTTIAETKTIILPDHSTVKLNAESQITYNENSFLKNRILSLSGEAFFEVAKGSKFTVKTTQGNIIVLGTKFNVFVRESRMNVQCLEGKIKVSNKQNSTILTSGKGTKSNNTEQLTPFDFNISTPLWTQGQSSFENISLGELIQELERQYNITINSKEIRVSRSFSGFFIHKNLQNALQTCFEPMNIKYTFVDSKTIELTDK